MISIVTHLPHQEVIISSVCLITSDAIVLVVTWLAAYNMGVLRCTSRWKYASFWKVLFYDGESSTVLCLLRPLTQAVGTIHFWYNADVPVVVGQH